jgi:hypothetical protein
VDVDQIQGCIGVQGIDFLLQGLVDDLDGVLDGEVLVKVWHLIHGWQVKEEDTVAMEHLLRNGLSKVETLQRNLDYLI